MAEDGVYWLYRRGRDLMCAASASALVEPSKSAKLHLVGPVARPDVRQLGRWAVCGDGEGEQTQSRIGLSAAA